MIESRPVEQQTIEISKPTCTMCSAMAWKEKSLELKVGAFLLSAVIILVAFVLVLGNFRFSDGYTLYVDFESSGGLRKGAKVKVAGITAGKVLNLSFLGGGSTDDEGNPIYVRAAMELDPDMAAAITEGSSFYVTTEGLLGEKCIEITPGPPDNDRLPAGAVSFGQPPVELQAATAKAVSLMENIEDAVQGEGKGITELVATVREFADHSRNIARRLDEELPALIADGKDTLARAHGSLDRLDAFLNSGTRSLEGEDGFNAAVREAGEVARQLQANIPPLVESLDETVVASRDLVTDVHSRLQLLEDEVLLTTSRLRTLIGHTDRLVRSIDADGLVGDARVALKQAVEQFAATGESLNRISTASEQVLADLTAITADVKKGRGSLGAFVRDREIYDDVRELILDLKKNPWKVLWKP